MIERLLRPSVALAYHGVGDVSDAEDPKRVVLSPGRFDAHVRLLLRRGYRFATASEIDPARRPEPRTALLTFDDGFAGWVTVVLPILRRLGVRATFYPCPGRWGGQHTSVLGEQGRLMDEAGARELHDAGMELGSHTLTHRDLRKLDDETLEREVRESKAGIEAVTGEPCRTFAYPYGLYDDRVIRAVRDAGYALAFTWAPGPWKPLEAPRLRPPPRAGAGELALELLGVRRWWRR
jgi:peptidoglycan/xylan/chitin deacetylase (PgdA/CDA1 family)